MTSTNQNVGNYNHTLFEEPRIPYWLYDLSVGCYALCAHQKINVMALEAICMQLHATIQTLDALRRHDKLSNCAHIMAEYN